MEPRIAMTEEGSGGGHVAARGEGRELFIGTLQVSAEQSDPLEVSEGKSPTGPCRLTFAPPHRVLVMGHAQFRAVKAGAAARAA